MEKTCTLCGESLPLESFYKAVGCKDGRAGQCIPCVRTRARIRQYVKRDEIRAYERERSKLPHRKMLRATNLIRERRDHPEKTAARTAVSNAVRDGKLLKMDCAFCGSSNTVAHHHDYARPLDVTWLCTPCHIRFHALEGMARDAKIPA
jgi:ribosomal protein S27AE